MTAIIFIIVLSVIVFVHELGHFVMAKRAGMKVEEFGFGFPPRIFGKKINDTIYSINWIPFGGFVKISGENESEVRGKGTFGGGSFLQKVGVVLAGVIMNVIFAVVLLSLASGIGSRIAVDPENSAHASDIQIQITQVAKGSPAEQAGLKVFDEIRGFSSVEEIQAYISDHKGREIILMIGNRDVRITPRANPPLGEGALGIALAKTGFVSYPWYAAIWRGIEETGQTLWAIVSGFALVIRNLASTGTAGVELAGPVGIAVVTGQAARLGLAYLLQFMAFISLNLAVINIVPFPALDGGRLLFILIEKLKGKPLSKRIENGFNTVGFVLLLLLMFYITVQDVLKFF